MNEKYRRDDSFRFSMDHYFGNDKSEIVSFNGGEVFVKHLVGEKVSVDAIDELIENFISNPGVVSLQITQQIPNHHDIMINITNKNIHRDVELVPATDTVPEHILLTIHFRMKDAEKDQQIQQLKSLGFEEAYVALGEGEYIDYGSELSSVCVLKLKMKVDSPWILREEPIQIQLPNEEDPEAESEPINGYILGMSVEKAHPNPEMYGASTGAVFVNIVSAGAPMFSNEQLENVVERTTETTNETIQISTNKDCEPVKKERTDFDSDEAYEEYVKSEMLRVTKIQHYWRNIFASKSVIIQQAIQAYATTYVESHAEDPEFKNVVEITQAEFEAFLVEQDLVHEFEQELINPQHDADEVTENTLSKLKVSDEANKILEEYQSIIPTWNDNIRKYAEQFGVLKTGESGKPELDATAEKYGEFVSAFLADDICKTASTLLHKYIIQMMRDTGDFTEEFLANDTEVRMSKVYREIAMIVSGNFRPPV